MLQHTFLRVRPMRWLLVLMIAAIVIFLFMRKEAASPPKPVTAGSPAPATLPTVPPLQPGTLLQQHPAPPPVAPPAQSNLPGQLAAVAERTGVRLVAFQPNTGGAMVVVEWSSDIATQGADFIEAALREGLIRDFDVTPRLSERMDEGRRVFIAQYQVKF
jgi:hypothetical protein